MAWQWVRSFSSSQYFQSDRYIVVFWGAAIVLFLAKIINLHNPDRQGFWVEVSSQVVNGGRTHLHSQDCMFTLVHLSLVYSYRRRLHTLPCYGHLS